MSPTARAAIWLGALAGGVVITFRKGNETVNPDGTDLDPRRSLLLDIARADLGPNKDPDVYWREAGAPGLVGTKADWCGGWVLSMLHRAGLGTELAWRIGKGFFSKLPTTRNPKPGDLVFFEQTDDDATPEQHQAIFESFGVVDGRDVVFTLDGNQDNKGTKRRHRDRSDVTAFYSIEPLLQGRVIA